MQITAHDIPFTVQITAVNTLPLISTSPIGLASFEEFVPLNGQVILSLPAPSGAN